MLVPKKAPAAYGVSYVYGVIGVILFVKLIPIILKKDIIKEEQELLAKLKSNKEMEIFHIKVTNPNVVGRNIGELNLQALAPVTFTRIKAQHSNESEHVSDKTRLFQNDLLRAIGTKEDVDKILFTLGEISEEKIQNSKELSTRRVLVSKKELTGKTIERLNIRNIYNVTISRIIRNGFEFPITPQVRLQIGDRVQLVGSERSLDALEEALGNNVESSYSAEAISLIIGLSLGFVIGQIPISLPGLSTFYLGNSGGVLASALLLGALYKTGPVTWAIPVPTNNFIRELGLYFFLAVVGISAGSTIVDTINEKGFLLLVWGMSVTTLTLILGYYICHKLLKIPFLQTLGVLTGGMTSTPGLAAASPISKTQFISSAYATVYPVAMISMIILTRLIITFLG